MSTADEIQRLKELIDELGIIDDNEDPITKDDLYDVIYNVVMLDDEPGDKATCEYIIEHYDVEEVYAEFNEDMEKFANWIRTFMY